jgi:hypothetical protein
MVPLKEILQPPYSLSIFFLALIEKHKMLLRVYK